VLVSKVNDYNYNYLVLVVNYVIDYFCNHLLINSDDVTVWSICHMEMPHGNDFLLVTIT